MSQAGFTPISLYFSATGAAVPVAGNLVAGELALNTNDGKLYFKNSSGVVTLLAGSSAGPAGGSNTQVQFNNSGALAGSANLAWNGTTLAVTGAGTFSTTLGVTGTSTLATVNVSGMITSSYTNGATAPTFSTSTFRLNGSGNPANYAVIGFDGSTAVDSFFGRAPSALTGTTDAMVLVNSSSLVVQQWNMVSGAVTIPGTLGVTGITTLSNNVNIIGGELKVQYTSGTDTQLKITSSATDIKISATYGTTGAYVPLILRTSDTDRLAISAAGAVTIPGTLGVTGNIAAASLQGTDAAVINGSYSTGVVADAGTATLTLKSGGSANLILIRESQTTGAWALFCCSGDLAGMVLVSSGGAGLAWTATYNTAASVNVYQGATGGGTGNPIIQNKTGSSKTFRVSILSAYQ